MPINSASGLRSSSAFASGGMGSENVMRTIFADRRPRRQAASAQILDPLGALAPRLSRLRLQSPPGHAGRTRKHSQGALGDA
ncbi:hypothetical protein Asi02nite_68570 [Asanoa siamensis]|uniref:Uncharacterized protein n=1 Tax=Asanoa siamensis TaxID=926357 RepID=A0ABQ4D1D2_9ACTN|nr:hypothetical protein Asi02nite_68570 [Asanoa siamensis]